MTNPAESRLSQWLNSSSREDYCSSFDPLPETGFAASLYQLCLLQLSRLVDSLASSTKTRRKPSFKDIQSKLVVFGDGFEDGQLESCLNSDDELRDIILGILYDIGKILTQDVVVAQLQKAKNVSDLPKEDGTRSLKQHLDQARAILGHENSEGDNADSDSSEDDRQTSVSPATASFQTKYLDALAANVDLLMSMCPAIEQTYRQKNYVSHARLLHAQRQISMAAAAHPYVSVMRDRFPLAERSLVERLGEANWQRHIRLRSIKSEETSVEPALSHLPKSLFQPVSIFNDSGLGSSLVNSERAPSISSHTSFISSNGGGDKGHFRVPGLPEDANYGERFPCPFCKKIISGINTRVDWKIHVFADLQAYICTFEECPEMMNTFHTRKAWFNHEKTHHFSQRSLQCRLCTEKFDETDEFVLHAGNDHDISINSANLRSAILSTATVITLKPADCLKCPLCPQKDWSSYRDYATHVGRHLEEIALCALPPNNDHDDGDEEDSSENSNTQTCIHAKGCIAPEGLCFCCPAQKCGCHFKRPEDFENHMRKRHPRHQSDNPGDCLKKVDLGSQQANDLFHQSITTNILIKDEIPTPERVGLIVETVTRDKLLTAIMDTGANCNILTSEKAKILGLSLTEPMVGETELQGISGVIKTLGTAVVPMRLASESQSRPVLFHVVEDHILGEHEALLGANLIKELEHQEQIPCVGCHEFVKGIDSTVKGISGKKTGHGSGDQWEEAGVLS